MHRILINWKLAQCRNIKPKTKAKGKSKKKGKQILTNGTGERSSIASCKRNAVKYISFYVQDLPSRNLPVAMTTRMMQIARMTTKSRVKKTRKRKILTYLHLVRVPFSNYHSLCVYHGRNLPKFF